ncbi:hypothetical protein Trydic_g14580 [Trypoxylus dichotomus]
MLNYNDAHNNGPVRCLKCWTGSVDETVEALFDKYFPRDEHNREEEEAGEVMEDRTDEPNFTAKEAVWGYEQEKVPGGDGFPTWALRKVLGKLGFGMCTTPSSFSLTAEIL